MNTTAIFFGAAAAAASAHAAFAGSGQPFDNLQPSLAVTQVMASSGIFPTRGGSGPASGDTLGFVYDFAGPYIPGNARAANGQLLPIAQNTALFSILGTTYGGNGFSAFALPNLQGAAVIGAGAGAGLTPRTLGAAVGSPTAALTSAQVPGPSTFSASQPYNTVQPSLPLETLIATTGVLPGQGGSVGSSAFIGQIANFAGGFAPSGWAPADGQLLPIASNVALFSVIGTTYGGNGTTTFALPDLQGRIAIGADAANPVGSEKGAESYTVNRSELPGPGQLPLSNDQPSLAINYLIATTGIFPANGGGANPFDPTVETLGEIVEFAGNYAPNGWALANGQLLPIAGNQALFSVIGTTYGGNGVTDFALPDLDGRTTIGAGGAYPAGDATGLDDIFLTAGELPSATTTVPEASTWMMMLIGLAGLGVAGRTKGRKDVSGSAMPLSSDSGIL